ncbi:MAG: SUMF1/EgtB/PvdO family nonheme iron enzyme, partial [Opitutaceae bacterium]
MHGRSCCAPNRLATPFPPAGTADAFSRVSTGSTAGMRLIPGGVFRMGNERDYGFPADGEGPVHTVELTPFWMDECAVTNNQFAAFVNATGYKTEAERFGWSFV